MGRSLRGNVRQHQERPFRLAHIGQPTILGTSAGLSGCRTVGHQLCLSVRRRQETEACAVHKQDSLTGRRMVPSDREAGASLSVLGKKVTSLFLHPQHDDEN